MSHRRMPQRKQYGYDSSLRKFISEIRGDIEKLLTINCDNQGAISLAKDNKFHAWTKHIDLQYHFIHEAVEDGKIEMK